MGVVNIDVVHKFVEDLIQDNAPFAESDHDQR